MKFYVHFVMFAASHNGCELKIVDLFEVRIPNKFHRGLCTDRIDRMLLFVVLIETILYYSNGVW